MSVKVTCARHGLAMVAYYTGWRCPRGCEATLHEVEAERQAKRRLRLADALARERTA